MTNPMMLSNPQTLTLVKSVARVVSGVTQKDPYGAVIYDQVSSTIPAAAIWPIIAAKPNATGLEGESGSGNSETAISFLAAISADVDISAIDNAIWRGVLYDIVGVPDYYSNPWTGFALQTIRLSSVEG